MGVVGVVVVVGAIDVDGGSCVCDDDVDGGRYSKTCVL